GSEEEVAVIWEPIDSEKYENTGVFTVEGTVEGTNIKAVAKVTVRTKSSGGSSGSGGGNSSSPNTKEIDAPETKPTPVTEQSPIPTPAPASESGSPARNFNDINESYSWAKNAIEELTSRGIIKGTSENTFDPGNNIVRADFMILLVKALNIQGQNETNFDDVNPSDYYYEALAIAKGQGITTGIGNNLFNPKAEITREDLMVLVARALEQSGVLQITEETDELKGFNDALNVAEYARKAIAALVREKIIKGNDHGMLNPKGMATRAEAAVVIYNILQNFQ
ncbi:MAG: S-layer homology domain-containing protein, partial [Thermotaleaceae bacterium]